MIFLKRYCYILIPFALFCGFFLTKFIYPCPTCMICPPYLLIPLALLIGFLFAKYFFAKCPPGNKVYAHLIPEGKDMFPGKLAFTIANSQRAFSIIITDGVFKYIAPPSGGHTFGECHHKFEYVTEGVQNVNFIEFTYNSTFYVFDTETFVLTIGYPQGGSNGIG